MGILFDSFKSNEAMKSRLQRVKSIEKSALDILKDIQTDIESEYLESKVFTELHGHTLTVYTSKKKNINFGTLCTEIDNIMLNHVDDIDILFSVIKCSSHITIQAKRKIRSNREI